MSVLFWNYSETQLRRMTKKQSIILDHWGKRTPLLQKDELENLLEGGVTYYGETALRLESHQITFPFSSSFECVTSDAISCSLERFSPTLTLTPHQIGTRLTRATRKKSAKITKMTENTG